MFSYHLLIQQWQTELSAEKNGPYRAQKDQDNLIIERPCLEILQNSEVIGKVQIINGMEEGNITRALKGEPVGTVIYRE